MSAQRKLRAETSGQRGRTRLSAWNKRRPRPRVGRRPSSEEVVANNRKFAYDLVFHGGYDHLLGINGARAEKNNVQKAAMRYRYHELLDEKMFTGQVNFDPANLLQRRASNVILQGAVRGIESQYKCPGHHIRPIWTSMRMIVWIECIDRICTEILIELGSVQSMVDEGGARICCCIHGICHEAVCAVREVSGLPDIVWCGRADDYNRALGLEKFGCVDKVSVIRQNRF